MLCQAAYVAFLPRVSRPPFYRGWFSIPLISFALSFSLPPSRNSDPGGHIAGSSPPLPATVRALQFYREKISTLFSLVDSRRIVPSHARRSQQLILYTPEYFLLQMYSKSHHGGIRLQDHLVSRISRVTTRPPG